MQVRKMGVVGGALFAFALATWAAGCGGQTLDVATTDGSTLDAQVVDAATDAQAADAASCPPHQVICNGTCADTRFDPSACGSCTNSCGPGEVCASGACTSTCPSTQAACKDEDGGLRCTDALNDNANCGYCGNVCGAGTICSNGKCGLTCGADETRCVAGDGTAFCTNLQTDPDDCNLCGNACPLGSNAASAFCSAGKCADTCNPGTLDCNGSPADGCEVTPASDRSNCGVCGKICAVGGSCVNGGCTCGTPYVDCTGMCTDVRVDSANCGTCGTRCTTTSINQSSTCVESACKTSNRGFITAIPVTDVALDDTYVYFVLEDTGIERVTKGSVGETPTLLIADTSAYRIAINAGTIFWNDNNGIYRCPTSGCVGSPTAIYDVPSELGAIAVDDTNVYWMSTFGLYMCAQAGCADNPLRLLNAEVTAMAPGPSTLFAMADSEGLGLVSVSLVDPSNVTSIAPSANSFTGIAYHNGQLYWEANQSFATYLFSCDPTACVPKIVAQQTSYNAGQPLVVDDTAVVWVADGIHETNLASGVDSVIANIESNAVQLALDPTNVYWAARDGVYWAPR
jgi:hypothetical protein